MTRGPDHPAHASAAPSAAVHEPQERRSGAAGPDRTSSDRARTVVAVSGGAVAALVLALPIAGFDVGVAEVERALLALAGFGMTLLLGAGAAGGDAWRVSMAAGFVLAALGAGVSSVTELPRATPWPAGFPGLGAVGAWISAGALPAFALSAVQALGTSDLPRSWSRLAGTSLAVGLLVLLAGFGSYPVSGPLRWFDAAATGAALLAASAAARPPRSEDWPAATPFEAAFRLISAGLAMRLLLMSALSLLPEARQGVLLAGTTVDLVQVAASALIAAAPAYALAASLHGSGSRVEELRASLRSSERRNAELLLAVPDLLFDLDPAGQVRFANARWRNILGVEPDQVVGTALLRWIHPDDHPAVQVAIETCRRGDPRGAECEVRAGGGASGWRTLHAALTPIRDNARSTASILGVCRDITDRRVLEKELAQSQRLERLGDLARGVAHDMNNVLGSIVTAASTIRAQRGLPQDLRLTVADIIESAEQGADLIRSLMVVGRAPRPGGPAWTPLGASIDRVLRVVTPNLGDRIRLVLDVAEDTPDVVGQAGQLEQVLMNLLLNARDALPEGGDIRLAAREMDGLGVIEVADNGVGIPDDVLPRIFEPYMSTKDAKGTGLGLSVVKTIVDDLGGRVTVRSRRHEGTTFVVQLPCRSPSRRPDSVETPPPSLESPVLPRARDRVSVPAGAPAPFQAPASSNPPAGAPLGADTLEAIQTLDALPVVEVTETAVASPPRADKVLVIDDEALVRRATMRALWTGGYEVDTAATLEEGLQRLDRGGIDVVLLDLSLSAHCDPASNLADVLSRAPGVPVILSSGNHAPSDINPLLTQGASAFLPKPAQLDDMLDTVRHVLVEARGPDRRRSA